MLKKPIASLIVSALLLPACGGGGAEQSASNAQAMSGAATQAPALGDVVVMLNSGASAAALASDYSASAVDQFGKRPIWRLQLAANANIDAVISALRADARVRFAEKNAEAQTPEARLQVVWAYGGDAGYMASQWAPQALALPAAHGLSRGAGVRVAVLDGGTDLTHPRLVASFARRGDGSVLGRDFVDGDDDPSETAASTDAGWGHGTHVAGLVALAAPEAALMPVRVLDRSARGNGWVLAEALMWAIDPDGDPATDDGAHVVNISLGTTVPTRLLNTAIELATCSDDDDNEDNDDYSDAGFDDDRRRCDLQKGVVVMAAAGNSGSSSELQYPAAEAAEGQLSITASAANGELAAFANSGTWVQLAAPGDAIVSTLPGGTYGTWSGTSMSTPLASGVAALVLARQPDWKPIDVTKRLLDRATKLCGTGLKGLHAQGAVADLVPPDSVCF
jgi:subtilisin family serine protease